jgi:hypothetical protein
MKISGNDWPMKPAIFSLRLAHSPQATSPAASRVRTAATSVSSMTWRA